MTINMRPTEAQTAFIRAVSASIRAEENGERPRHRWLEIQCRVRVGVPTDADYSEGDLVLVVRNGMAAFLSQRGTSVIDVD